MRLVLRLMIFVETWIFLTGTFYNWRSKFAGLEVNEAKRLRELESENNKLKKLLAEKLLEVEAMKDVVSKKW
jgi:putative transposase